MTRHLFFTGEKGSGKSTRIKNILQNHPDLTVKGFLTVRVKNSEECCSVHMLKAGTDEEPDDSNLLFYCGRECIRLSGEEVISRFNRLGSLILEDIDDADIIIMDELGPHEELAEAFKTRVLELLDGETAILGVIQKADSAFLNQIKAHPRVDVEEVIRNF